MLGKMLGDQAVGEYAAATKISAIWYFIPTMLASSLYPAIVNAKSQGDTFYKKRLQQYMDLNAGLAYLIILPVTLLAPWMMDLLYGSAYKNAAPILALHVWAGLFVFLGVARGQYLLTEKLHKFSLAATLTGAMLNVVLNFCLIPSIGGAGAAIATLGSQAVSAFLSSFLWFRTKILGSVS